ncbi:acyl carrier protein [Candidatus Saccharibacteria bacterium]|nr:acyl carrier protein [Candidatus Saccharibacteria bacterium]MBR2993961.1 acyl carrier protein [Candidatus Saccharibacteria bacterium]
MLEEFKKFLDEELGIDDDITLETSLRDDLMIDSLATTQLVLSLEEKYNIKVEQSELAKLKTVKNCLDLLAEKGIESAN